jgi:hypothetical protein
MMMRAIFAIATVLVGSVLTALAEPKSVTVKNSPDDAPCEVFRRDEKGSWHLRDGIVIVTGSLGGVSGDLKVTKWTGRLLLQTVSGWRKGAGRR